MGDVKIVPNLEQLAINTIRTLSIDGKQTRGGGASLDLRLGTLGPVRGIGVVRSTGDAPTVPGQ